MENVAMDETKIFSPKGRFGRVKFACWGTLFLMLPRLLEPVGLFILPITFIIYIFTILKRLRDIDMSPWWALLAWIPVLNFPLLFISGNKSVNRFGYPPRPFTSSERIFAIFLPIVFIGILAGSLLPKYLETYEYYKQKAESEKVAPNK
jgi:uncharacterized membrane protein YhaH (DUF805 family)